MASFTRDPPIPVSPADEKATSPVEQTIPLLPLDASYRPTKFDPVYPSANTDFLPPVESGIAPANGQGILANQAFVGTVLDAVGVKFFELCVDQGGRREVVFDGSVLVAPYVTNSTVTPVAVPGGFGFTWSITRDGGWISNPIFRIRAIDLAWNQL